ncbi:MAG TPA: sulfite exporter TauE/SafE family protein [Vicinamibacterales bacterium]|nr:sulfite exporter TauE/SafE family protein [Vicinamibacterales bacterium]
MSGHHLALAVITFVAALVNGALGYGFSSITVPLALLLLPNRTLNPALVLLEIPLNASVLWANRAAIPQVWRRVLPILIGLLPGILAGTFVVLRVSPPWLKLGTLAALLPLTLLQAGGVRRPIRSERRAGFLFGGGLGTLYAVTTISGPPLALALNNQGVSKDAFRAALGLVRLVASLLTASAYLFAGLFVRDSVALIPWMLPSVAIGVPVGAIVIRQLQPETFRRICMSFDAWVVSFGISTLLRELRLVDSMAAYLVVVVTVLIDGYLLARFFSGLSESVSPIEHRGVR